MRQIASSVFGNVGKLGIGFALKKSLDYVFDYGIYPLAIISMGYTVGGIVMTMLSVVINVMVIKGYDWAKQDLLMIELFKKSIHQNEVEERFSSLKKFISNNDTAAFFLLSWVDDPITVTLYMRKGSYQYNGLSFRDWNIFLASTIVSNLFWIVSLGSIMEILKVFFR